MKSASDEAPTSPFLRAPAGACVMSGEPDCADAAVRAPAETSVAIVGPIHARRMGPTVVLPVHVALRSLTE